MGCLCSKKFDPGDKQQVILLFKWMDQYVLQNINTPSAPTMDNKIYDHYFAITLKHFNLHSNDPNIF